MDIRTPNSTEPVLDLRQFGPRPIQKDPGSRTRDPGTQDLGTRDLGTRTPQEVNISSNTPLKKELPNPTPIFSSQVTKVSPKGLRTDS